MNKTRNEVMEDAYEIIRKQVIEEVLDSIMSKQDAIRKLLDNGRPVLETAIGERFGKLYDKRLMLWHKLHNLSEAWNMVCDMR